MNMAKDNLGSVSYKGEKVCSYSAKLKLEVIWYTEVNSDHATSWRFRIDQNSICGWRRKHEKIGKLFKTIKDTSSFGAKGKWLDGGGRHVTDEESDENLLEWFFERRESSSCFMLVNHDQS